MLITSDKFNEMTETALADAQLRTAFARASSGFISKRSLAIERIANFSRLRSNAAAVKDHTLANAGYYLRLFEERATAQGAQVHWAQDGEELNRIVVDLAKSSGARRINKGKSMVSEETELNHALNQADIEVTETDLGEYILQLAAEAPSHLIAPAIHKTREEIATLFHNHHRTDKYEEEPAALVEEARQVLRKKYRHADVGITGANFLIAEKGAMLLVTNEGNGDLSSALPPVHIVTVGWEKVVPTMHHAFLMLRLLTSSATGQPITSYVTIIQRPAIKNEMDGPSQLHYVLLDNGRSKIWQSRYRKILRCIRCGACLNHCPVYTAVGGHTYGSVYPGPMGAVLTPLLADAEQAMHLPNASSFCGRCEEVCPVAIPLPDLMRQLRAEQRERGFRLWDWGMNLYMKTMLSPLSYRITMKLLIIWFRLVSRHKTARALAGFFPLARAWSELRDFPQPHSSREVNVQSR